MAGSRPKQRHYVFVIVIATELEIGSECSYDENVRRNEDDNDFRLV